MEDRAKNVLLHLIEADIKTSQLINNLSKLEIEVDMFQIDTHEVFFFIKRVDPTEEMIDQYFDLIEEGAQLPSSEVSRFALEIINRF